MSIITRMLKQSGVYWAPAAANKYGEPTWASPVDISVRWVDVTEEFVDSNNEQQMSKAKVNVSVDVIEGGVLYLGTTTESGFDSADPKANFHAWEIRRFEKLPNFKATEFLRTCFL